MKKLLSLLITLSMLITALPLILQAKSYNRQFTFFDVKSDDWSNESISYCFEKGYVAGTSHGRFLPTENLSRAMAVTILRNISNNCFDYSKYYSFKDVPNTKWYHNSVEWACEYNITSGVGNGEFAPDLYITRQDFICMLYRFAQKYAHAPRISDSGISLVDFIDGSDSAEYAITSLNWAIKYSIINGYDGRINPNGSITREQAMSIISGYDKSLGHDWLTVEILSDRSCITKGETLYKCSVCKAENEVITAAYHIWDDGSVIEKASCTVNGLMRYYCVNCDTYYDEVIPANGYHNYTDWEYETFPTASSCGTMSRYCTICSDTNKKLVRYSGYYQIQDSISLPNAGYNLDTDYIGLKVIKVNQALLGTSSASYTASTLSAVTAFQRSHGLYAYGGVNLATWLAIGYTEYDWYNLGRYITPKKVTEFSTKDEYINAMLDTAGEYANAGTTYRIGCSGEPGTYADCSGLIYQCLYSVGICPDTSILDHALAIHEFTSRDLAADSKLGQDVYLSDIKRGDLIFYANSGTSTVIHVSIYAGGGMIYDAWPNIGTTYRSMYINGTHIVKVKRIFP